MRRLTSLLPVLLALVLTTLSPPLAFAQDVVLDDEVVLSERPRGGGGWSTPGAVLPGDQGALASELFGILQSQPPLLPARAVLPSRATLDVTAYPSFNRRTGLPCVGCRNPCRSFRYTYARPDRGTVTVEGQRCRRRSGQWVAYEPDIVVGERAAAPGAPMTGAFQGAPQAQSPWPAQSQAQSQSQAMRRVVPTPLPPARPGDVAVASGAGPAGAAPSPFDPPLVGGQETMGSMEPVEPASSDFTGSDGRLADAAVEPDEDLSAAQPLPGSADDVWSTAALPDIAPPEDDAGPMVLDPSSSAAVAAAEAALAPPAEATTEPAAPPSPEVAPVETAVAAPPATPEPIGATPTAPSAAPDAAVETQTARVIMQFGGEQADPVEVETTADPDVVRMLRMLRYLDPETSAEPTPQAFAAAVSDFASDERFALPLSNSALRERLEGAVDRLAALSSCPATSGDGYGVCLTAAR